MMKKTMNDESRALRQSLAQLCATYNDLIADKDTIDYRLGSPEPYGKTQPGTNAERVYETESKSLSDDIRKIIVEIIEAGQRIRSIEGF